MTTEDFAHIDGRITPRLENVLRRAAEISESHGYDYLAVEHVALAIVEDEYSVPTKAWHGAMTVDEWRDAIVEALPPLPEDTGAPEGPIRVEVSRRPLE